MKATPRGGPVAAGPPPRRHPPPSARAGRTSRRVAGERGVLALEFALLLPLVGLLLLAVVLAGVHAADQLVVQDAARAAARVAATTVGHDPPRHAAERAATPRLVDVRVVPARRPPGTRLLVTVTHHRSVGWLSWTVRGHAAAVVEPGVR